MSKNLKIITVICITIGAGYGCYLLVRKVNPNPKFKVGQVIDSLNGVKVYYNGNVGHTGKRNVSPDGYNIGLTWQCVEFVKRYYYEFYHHKMPDAYGNAKDFFDRSLKDGELSKKRDLIQYNNPSKQKPSTGDLVIFDGSAANSYGHVAIISRVTAETVEIIQQNPGPFASSRVNFLLDSTGNRYKIQEGRLLGWLRMKK